MLVKRISKLLVTSTALLLLVATSGCVFRANIAQGNIVEQDDLDQLEVGMTTNQVRFLLGTPMIDDPFNADRWDYAYYVKVGRQGTLGKRWVAILFEDGRVSEIRKDLELEEDL